MGVLHRDHAAAMLKCYDLSWPWPFHIGLAIGAGFSELFGPCLCVS